MRLTGGPLVLATHNPGKLGEMADLVRPFGFELLSAGALGLAEPEETGATFEENALIKARAAAQGSGLPALADDSGLAVDALGGDPGVFSARWAGPEKDFSTAMQEVERRLRLAGATLPDERRAQFVCALALATPDGREHVVAGVVAGTLVWPPRGEMGFGYDPMFLPNGHSRTFGEMSAEEKHGWRPGGGEPLSHRARAFAQLAKASLTG